MREYAKFMKSRTRRAARFHGRSRALSLYTYLYINKYYTMFILGTFIMREYAKGTTRRAARFPGRSRALSLYKYRYIDK